MILVVYSESITKETNGIVFAYLDDKLKGYITYHSDDELWKFHDSIDADNTYNYLVEDNLIDVMSEVELSGTANNFELITFEEE